MLPTLTRFRCRASRDEHLTAFRPVALVIGLLTAAACGPPPSAPAAVSQPATLPLSLPGSDMRVTGTVTDERGLPVDGASVSVTGSRVTSTTNAAGRFELSGAFGSNAGAGIVATRDGYEPNYQWVPFAAEAVRDVRLRLPVVISSGGAATVLVDSHDTLYGSAEQFRARRVRVLASDAGQLIIEGTSNHGGPAALSDGPMEYSPCCPHRLNLNVSRGQEVVLHVLTFYTDVPVEFSVTTRLEPR